MVEKIFEKIGSIQEINEIAADLRRIGLKEELETLAKNNRVPDEDVKAYLQGKRYFLVDGGDAKSYETARSKLLDEMGFLNDRRFGDIIGNFLLECCDMVEFSELVLKKHKTLQRCIEYLMSNAQGMVSDEEKKSSKGTCVAVGQDSVYEWARAYYEKDDAAEAAKAVRSAEASFLKRNEIKTKSSSSKQPSGIKSTSAAAGAGKKSKTEHVEEKKSGEKNQIEGQVSLF